jgi:TonB family protein
MRNVLIALCVLGAIARTALAHEPEEEGEAKSGTIAAPVLIERSEPVYPESARQAGIGGIVGLELTVDADGAVSEAKVVRSAGFGLDEAALAAARRFKFRPATRDGKAIASTVLFDQRFAVRPHLVAEATAEPAVAQNAAPAAPAAPPVAPETKHENYESTVVASGPTISATSTTIRSQDFELRPRTTPNDILRVVPGLLAVQHQGGGKADQIFLRGFDADHGTDVAIFIDGIPVNMPSHAHGQGYADLHWLIPEALERIDVMKGPYDVRWGDFATAGAINLITRERFESSSVQYTMGMYPTIANRALAQGRFVGILAPELPGWASKLHPWLAFEAAYDNGPFTASEDLKRYNLFGKLTYDLAPHFKLGLFFQAYGSGWVGSGQIPSRDVGRIGQFGSEDPSEGGLTERQMFTAFAHYRNGDHEVNATLYVTRYRLSLFNDFTFFLHDPVNGDEIEQDDARVFSGGKISYHVHRHWHGISLRSTVGVEMRYDGIHVDRWNAESQNGDFRKRLSRRVDTSGIGFGANDNIDISNLAAYAEEDVVFNRWLRLIGGLRADFFAFNVDDLSEALGAGQPATSGTRQFPEFSPKASFVLTPVRELLDVYLNFGMGFHSNQAQVALQDGTTGAGFTLHAIPKFYGGEIGARAHLWNRLDFAAAFWMSYLENETVFDPDNAAFVPSEPTRRLGFDFDLRARLLNWLFADLDLAQASTTTLPAQGNGGALALAPKIYITGGLTVRHRLGIQAGLRFRYLGDRPAFDETSPEYQYFTAKNLSDVGPNPDYDPSRVIAQGYFIMDAYAAYRWRWLELVVGMQNLLNSPWREAQFGNHSCTHDEVYNPANPNYSGSGNQLQDHDHTFVNRCGIGYAIDRAVGGKNTRAGVVDVHYTPGIPFNLQLTLKAYF